MNGDLVSFIIAAYNEEDFIIECVESCLNQTYKNIEIVITDDGSTDSTWSLLKNNYSANNKVKLLRFHKNQKKIAAFNNSFRHANGEFIAIMGADDINYFDRLEKQIPYLNHYDLVFGTLDKVDEYNDNIIEKSFGSRSNDKNFEIDLHQMVTNPFGLPSILINKSLADRIFPLHEDLVHEDYWIPFCASIEKKFLVINTPVYRYRMHCKNSSGNNYNFDYTESTKRKLAVRDIAYWKHVHNKLINHNIKRYNEIVSLKVLFLEYLQNAFSKDENTRFNFFKQFTRKLKKTVFPHSQDFDLSMISLYQCIEYDKTLKKFNLIKESHYLNKKIPQINDRCSKIYSSLERKNRIKNTLRKLLSKLL